MRTILASLLLLTACGGAVRPAPVVVAPPENHAPDDAPARPSIRSVDFKNFTYDRGPDGTYPTVDGEVDFVFDEDGNRHMGEYTPASPDAYIERGFFSVSPAVYGDVDGDGVEDAAVTTVLNTGGTGMFDEVDVYRMSDGGPVLLGAIPGGDRGDGGISGVSIEGGVIMVERFQLSAADGACCPSELRHEEWHWRNGELVEDQAARTTSPVAE